MKAGQVPKINGELPNGVDGAPVSPEARKKIVVVGLGMVGVAFM